MARRSVPVLSFFMTVRSFVLRGQGGWPRRKKDARGTVASVCMYGQSRLEVGTHVSGTDSVRSSAGIEDGQGELRLASCVNGGYGMVVQTDKTEVLQSWTRRCTLRKSRTRAAKD